MRVIICGGRDYQDHQFLEAALDELCQSAAFSLVIDGAARGADTMAYQWAESRGLPTQRFPADWDSYGRSAGPRRNKQMLEEGEPDLVVAFPGGRGTSNMIEQASAAGVPVKFIGWSGPPSSP